MVLINGHELNVEIHGPEKGTPVVLLHHGLGSVQAWRSQINALEGAGYRVVAYDRWGYGASEPRPQPIESTFKVDVQDLHAVLHWLGSPKVTLVGHSDGGTIALYYAMQHPEAVAGLVTVAAHIYVEGKMGPGIEGVRWAFENDRRFQEGLRRVHGEKYRQVFFNWYNGWMREENLYWNIQPLLSQVSCPTLVVQGTEDEHATPQHAIDIARAIQGAELWLLESAGHMLPQERADVFTPKLLDFLDSRLKA